LSTTVHPQPQFAPAPAPKKRSGFKTFLIICAAIFTAGAIGIIALVALLGAAANEASKAIDKELANDKPKVVAEGAAFEHDGYQVAKGWSIGTDELGSPTIKDLRVTNVDHEVVSDDAPMFTFSLWQGKSNLVEIEASGRSIQQGESTTMDAYSTDNRLPKYTTVKVKDMW
jgi:hypothetical protein